MAAGDPGVLKRNFSAVAIQTTLVNTISSAATGDTTTSVAVVSVSGFPSTVPYTLILDPDGSKEEVVTVTAATSTTLTITRGQDNTPAVAHAAGTSVRHGVSARDFKEEQTHIAARGYDADTAILSSAGQSHVHGLVSGDGSVVGADQVATLTRKTLTTPTINGATLTGTVTSTASVVVSGAGTITGLSSAGMVASSATPKSYVDAILGSATAASTSATSAATSATSAATSATSAAASATASAASASAAATSASSALTSQTAAATSATSAAASATAAATSASSAGTSATASASSASASATSATASATSASSAATSATAAATSAASAATSATASATSAGASATSATAAATSATSAAASATAAATSATSAAASATTASNSAATATTQAANAATSAASALVSQTAAATSATSAAASATAAATSATSASASATAAATSATSAAASATAATTSATSAAASATAASTSATNAATSASSALTSQTAAATSAASAATSATSAANSATAANNSASSASGFATAASTSAASAATSASDAATTYDNFDDRYLGSKSSAPTVDNDGNTLLVGAIYWNSTLNNMYVWSGSAWVQIATTSVYTAPTIGSTTINSGTTYSTVTGLTLSGGLASADPTASLGLATKQYVDLVTAGINYHAPVVAASVSNLSATYNNGTSGVGATLTADTNRAFSTLDGQAVSVGQRILIKDQTTQLQNGIYTLTTVGSGAAPWVITRATDNDASPELANGDVVNVTGGTVNSGKTFVNSSAATIVVGTTAITFASYYTGLPSQTGSAGLALTTDGTTPSWSSTINGTTIPSTKTLVVTTDKLSVHAATTSAELAGVISDETGTGALVFANSPTLVTPALGTPASATLTNATGLPVSGITASTTTALGVGSIELGHATDTTISRASAGVVNIEGVPIVTTTASQTLTNKTLTTPVISSISNTGTLTLPTSTDTLVGKATTDTLTNKTLTSPILTTPSISNIDAKGDILVGTANDTLGVLAAGNNGETLVADSSTSTGLRYQANFAAGKNKIINGDFGVWQRGTSFNASTLFYTADRWAAYSYSGASQTVSQQTFTAGTAPVSGYEGTYFLRATATNTGINVEQRIEDVRTFAGQTVTLSFWAKSNSAQTITLYLNQNFGSGGSSQVTALTGTQAITTSWTRYTLTGTLPSISGKTIGTSSYLQVNFVGASINNALDIWGVQVEAGSVATAFQTATGTLQGELAACQRYYERRTAASIFEHFGVAQPSGTTLALATIQFNVTKRAIVTSVDYYALGMWNQSLLTPITLVTLLSSFAGYNSAVVEITSSSLTAQMFYQIIANASTLAYIGFSAEL